MVFHGSWISVALTSLAFFLSWDPDTSSTYLFFEFSISFWTSSDPCSFCLCGLTVFSKFLPKIPLSLTYWLTCNKFSFILESNDLVCFSISSLPLTSGFLVLLKWDLRLPAISSLDYWATSSMLWVTILTGKFFSLLWIVPNSFPILIVLSFVALYELSLS